MSVLLLFAGPAAGQTTDEGIRAMLRGDYREAARVLVPLADDDGTRDPVAQFFAAVLYETGQGVPRDVGRACTLFLRSGTHAHPLAEQSTAIGNVMREQLGGASSTICRAAERSSPSQAPTHAPFAAMRYTGADASTADGVIALARGDVLRAVDILKPIAEDWRADDPAAQFFMAGLYEAGHGMPVDPLRACALYMRAGGNMEHPFGRQANALWPALVQRGAEFNEECQLLFRVGFQHGFEPALFDLGPQHFVDWTLFAASVTYENGIRRHEMLYAQRGARFLPLRHTELATGPAGAIKRHFIEMFIWTPLTQSGPWQLHWHIFEVVRNDIIRVGASDPPVTMAGENPPSADRFDVRDYAALRLDDEGYAEWAVLKGPHAHSERIESDAERREEREAGLARDAALKKTDWAKRDDVNREPAFVYSDADGCGHVQIYGWSADRMEAVVIRASAPETPGSAQSLALDLARDAATIVVETHVFAGPERQFYFCSDVGMPVNPDSPPRSETWRAIAGTVSIEWSEPGVRARRPHLRRATVTLRDVVLRSRLGVTVKVPRPIRLTAVVGAGFGG